MLTCCTKVDALNGHVYLCVRCPLAAKAVKRDFVDLSSQKAQLSQAFPLVICAGFVGIFIIRHWGVVSGLCAAALCSFLGFGL